MFKLYYCSAIDVCVEEAFKQMDEFKKIFSKYPKIEVFGAGFGESPIIGPDSSLVYKGVVVAYDLREIRKCDILLVVTDLKTFCAGTMEEMMYSRQLGLYIIVCILRNEKLKNIFIETHADKVIYGIKKLKEVLDEICKN